MSIDPIVQQKQTIKTYLRAGALTLFLLIFGIGGWSVLASIDSAVITSGVVVKDSNNKRIQHMDGGIVDFVHIKEGQLVYKGDLLVSLDNTRIQAEVEMLKKRLFERNVRRLRLLSAQDGGWRFELEKQLRKKAKNNPSMLSFITAQNRLFKINRQSTKNRKDQLKERIAQLNSVIAGYKLQLAAKEDTLGLLAGELADLSRLRHLKLVSVQRLNSTIRNKNEIRSTIGRLISNIAKARGQISELKLKIIGVDNSHHQEGLKELADVEDALLGLRKRLTNSADHLWRMQIRAPQSGYVHELQTMTSDTVIRPGETLMKIVPHGQDFTVDAKITPTVIDQVTIGQKTHIRFTSFNQRETPTLFGMVHTISPDQSVSKRTGESFFLIRINVRSDELKKLAGKAVLAGMPAEIMIPAAKRTVISYLTKPLTNQLNRAFREE